MSCHWRARFELRAECGVNPPGVELSAGRASTKIRVSFLPRPQQIKLRQYQDKEVGRKPTRPRRDQAWETMGSNRGVV